MPVHRIPADGAETAAECIPAVLIFLALFLYRIKWSCERRDGSLLQREKHTKADLLMKLAESTYYILSTNKEADPCAGQIKTLGKGEKLHTDLFGTGII